MQALSYMKELLEFLQNLFKEQKMKVLKASLEDLELDLLEQ